MTPPKPTPFRPHAAPFAACAALFLSATAATAADSANLQRRPRRHVATYPQVYAAGHAARRLLPIALKLPVLGRDFGRMDVNISVRFQLGSLPDSGSAALVLGFDAETPALAARELVVRVNGVVCDPAEELPPPYDRPPAPGVKSPSSGERPEDVAQAVLYAVPFGALHDDVNVAECEPAQVSGTLNWAEILLVPDSCGAGYQPVSMGGVRDRRERRATG